MRRVTEDVAAADAVTVVAWALVRIGRMVRKRLFESWVRRNIVGEL